MNCFQKNGMSSTLAIRVDANEIIASGHVMRCLAIAKQVERLNWRVLFLTSSEETAETIKSYGYECVATNVDFRKKNAEVSLIKNIITDRAIDRILIDSYQVTKEYFDQLIKMVKIAYIDDLQSFKYNANLIVNYTLGVEFEDYLSFKYNQEVKFLLGSKFIPLREEFGKKEIQINKEVRRIFITTGGTDSFGIIIKLVKELAKTEYLLEVVVGRYYNDCEMLKRLAGTTTNISIHRNISNISDVMKQCDLAISAGGTTLAELCAMGIPTICFSMADNQVYGAKAYSDAGAMRYAGDVRDGLGKLIERIKMYTEELIGDYNIRCLLGERAKEIIDGNGAKRIAVELVAM